MGHTRLEKDLGDRWPPSPLWMGWSGGTDLVLRGEVPLNLSCTVNALFQFCTGSLGNNSENTPG